VIAQHTAQNTTVFKNWITFKTKSRVFNSAFFDFKDVATFYIPLLKS